MSPVRTLENEIKPMKQLFPDLWQTPVEMRFGTLISHAYVLELDDRSELFYVAENAKIHAAINALGQVDHLYLSHNHEITEGLAESKAALGTRLVGHREMQKYFPDGLSLDQTIETENRASLAAGLTAIYTPGHTDNNICYRYASPHGETYLFVGDTLYPQNGAWKALFMKNHGGDRETLIKTLENLKNVQADVIIPSVAVGQDLIAEMSKTEWHVALDAAIASLSE